MESEATVEQLREAHRAQVEAGEVKRESQVGALRAELQGEVERLKVELEATGAVSLLRRVRRRGKGERRS